MEIIKKYSRKLLQHLKLSNKKDFDDDFGEILQIYHFFNLYHPHQTLKKQTIGIMGFSLVTFSYLGGILMAILEAFHSGDIHKAMLLTSLAALFGPFVTQNLSMSLSQDRIINLIKILQSLHNPEDESEMQLVRKRCVKMLKWYKVAFLSFNTVFVFKLLGFNLCNLFAPTVYDKWAKAGCFYWILLLVNFLHIYLVGAFYYVSENFHFLCIMRIEANLKLLCQKLRRCTSGSKKDNEKELISLARYHLAIIEAANELQSICKLYFAQKLYGLYLELILGLFILVNSNIREELNVVLFMLLMALTIVAQFGVLCLFGQRIDSLADDLTNATFECEWFTQSKGFKKSLLIVREACAIPIEFGVLGKSFCHENFCSVLTAVYQSFNTFSSAVSSQKKN